MSIALTTRLSSSSYSFLQGYAIQIGKPKNAVIEAGLELLKRAALEKDIRNGFASRQDEYSTLARTYHSAQSSSLTI
jgi:hypothetical protein